MALVRDPAFWRRFSRAIYLDAEAKADATTSGTSTDNLIYSDTWIQAQNRKKRRGVICCVSLSVAIITIAVAIIVVLWWFGTHNWGREQPDSRDINN
ncbi:hypothetical protein FE257_000147 [Aspergillus nanangensis]|uniref:Uncharacterized protein n=1 Tax=Aspergillus nanangensis TaxID=2582783 RepID=A0AAD4CYV6_ASPNN|nr:hypothetical protein FE257_000147 [Aspergillus nanangensis]